MSTQGLLADHYLYTGRNQFNDRQYFAAEQSFAKLVDGASGLEQRLVGALRTLAAAFELLRGRRMLDPARLALADAVTQLDAIPLGEVLGLDVRRLKDELACWVTHLGPVGSIGHRPPPPPDIRL